MVSPNIDASQIVGKPVKDDSGRDVGKIISLLINSSGQAEEVLIKNRNDELQRCLIDRLEVKEGEVTLCSEIDKKASVLLTQIPLMWRKKQVLEKLSGNSDILPEVCEKLHAEFDKVIEDLKADAKNLMNDIESQIHGQEESIKMLHMARTFLEIEHGIENIEKDVYQQSLLSILKELKYASYQKLNLIKMKEKLSSILDEEEAEADASKEIKTSEDQEDVKREPTEQSDIITVHLK